MSWLGLRLGLGLGLGLGLRLRLGLGFGFGFGFGFGLGLGFGFGLGDAHDVLVAGLGVHDVHVLGLQRVDQPAQVVARTHCQSTRGVLRSALISGSSVAGPGRGSRGQGGAAGVQVWGSHSSRALPKEDAGSHAQSGHSPNRRRGDPQRRSRWGSNPAHRADP